MRHILIKMFAQRGKIVKAVVYAGEGVNPLFLRETVYTFRKFYPCITMVNDRQLAQENWEKNSALFIVPGGRDVPYDRKIQKKEIHRIDRFVKRGGSFLGICAGAYFASNEILFEKGTPQEVCEKRNLKFFPGSAVGALYPFRTFAYNSESGAHAARVVFKKEALYLYYNGGCTFQLAETFPSVTVLGRYQDADNQPAIIHCRVGRGNVLLSGVHFEVRPHVFKGKEGTKDLIHKLEASNEARQNLTLSLLKFL